MDTQGKVASLYPAKLIADLSNSGLTPTDVRPKPIGPAERAATGTPVGVDGYSIPYYSIDGKPLPFYRVKLYDRDKVKYLQVADQPNHIYFPPNFWKIVQDKLQDKSLRYIIWTEGEKKAAKAVKEGFPAVAVTGVDSWRSRTLAVPKEAQISQKKDGGLAIKMPSGVGVAEAFDTIAQGMQNLIDLIVKHKLDLIIVYDTDAPLANVTAKYSFGISQEVQRAAATLGFEMRHRGIPLRKIRQLILPAINEDKTGLDDYLIDMGATGLNSLVESTLAKKSAFPQHPNTRDYVNKKLQKGNLSRSDQMGLSLAIISDLDGRGQRLRSPDAGLLYYFSYADKSLTPVTFTGKPDFAESPFGRKLYRDYNLGIGDQRILGWISTQFSAEEPVATVNPEKVLTWRGNTLYYHISDGVMAKVSSKGITLVDNGEDGVLFEAGLVEDIDSADFLRVLKASDTTPIQNWWLPVLQETRIKDYGDGAETERHKQLLSLLYYVSPFFYRWRGTQLPVEITHGEAGSGKSTLFELRLSILTGIPKLRNSPQNIKDWNAALAKTGALHVTDNVAMQNAELRNQMSDEICRLITEPNPSIEQRKLYSDTDLINIPVRVVFGITAIKQPFTNVDIIQRAVITEMDKGIDAGLTYDANWKETQLEKHGGRVPWLVHQLRFVQRMLQLIEKEWNPQYKAKYRLINLEQLLILAGKACDTDASWIAQHLESSRDKRAQESDWVLEGLMAFAEQHRRKFKGGYDKIEFKLADISDWCLQEDDFKACQMLVQSRNLRRYIEGHKHTVATVTNIVESRVYGNGTVHYKVRNPQTG